VPRRGTNIRCALLLSCEHGGARIPARYTALFADAPGLLRSHRAYDRGALALARLLARRLGAPLVFSTTSRLLVDLNRSPHHAHLFSPRVRALGSEERARILERHYWPHRRAVERRCGAALRARARILHLAVHSFTPVLRGTARTTDLGLLYDPARAGERELCERLRAALRAADPRLRVRRNHPYRGSADGLATALRARLPGSRYLGVELEVSQRLSASAEGRARVLRALIPALEACLRVPRRPRGSRARRRARGPRR
jgi:predicted N-formylglutamate amidohydrolase